MRKFLTVSVCLFASLIANAKVEVTTLADGADSITISSALTLQEVESARKQLSSSILKIATSNYELTASDWQKIILNYTSDQQLVKDNVSTFDFSNARTASDVFDSFQIGQYIGSHNAIRKVIWTRYNNIPKDCFSYSDHHITSITIPDKKDGTEAIEIGAYAFTNMSALKELSIGSCVVETESIPALGDNLCDGCASLTTVHFNTPTIKSLPARAFENCKSLRMINLPNNLEVINECAFQFCGLKTISFPNSLLSIKQNAFNVCDLQYVVIPENVKEIETCAFQGNENLTDVYLMGNDVKCAENGFAKSQNCSGFKNEETGFSQEAPASREDWKYGDKTPIVLHFVAAGNETFKNYENPYWIMLNTPGILDELKGFDKDNAATMAAFIEKYNLQFANSFPWSLYYYANDNTQPCPFAYYKYTDNDGKEKTCKLWRDESGYYSDSNIQNSNPDYAGWRQFLIIQDDAKQNTFEDEHRVDDRWYSMCFPFDLNANQIRTAYGAGTKVCEFIGAWDTKEQTEKGETIINFRFKPLLDEDCTDALVEEEDARNARGTSSPIITKANHAYMIHPASKKEGDNTNVWHRIIPGIPAELQIGEQAKLIPTIPEENKEEIMNKYADGDNEMLNGYRFIGNYEGDTFLPGNSYYFAYRDYADGSRSLILNHLTRQSAKNKWTPMTALVLYTGSATNAAKCFNAFSFFTEEKKSETTGIHEIGFNTNANTETNNQKIYNLNGQVVKEGNNLNGLGKGLYIVNGKKYIVK